MSGAGLRRTPASSFEDKYRDLGNPWCHRT
jgi:hypothetical protein